MVEAKDATTRTSQPPLLTTKPPERTANVPTPQFLLPPLPHLKPTSSPQSPSPLIPTPSVFPI